MLARGAAFFSVLYLLASGLGDLSDTVALQQGLVSLGGALWILAALPRAYRTDLAAAGVKAPRLLAALLGALHAATPARLGYLRMAGGEPGAWEALLATVAVASLVAVLALPAGARSRAAALLSTESRILRRIYRELEGNHRAWVALVALMLVAYAVRVSFAHQTINWDVAMYVQVGQLLSEGAIPYVDFHEINPPLIMYLNVPPALLAKALGIPASLAFAWMVVAGVMLSTAGLYAMLAKMPRLGRSAQGLLTLAWIGASFSIARLGETGQREHLFLIAAGPYLALRCARVERSDADGPVAGTWLAIALGIVAGLGAAIKPHYLAMIGAVELLALWRTRSLRALMRPEVIALVVVEALYVAHWSFVPSVMRSSFFGRWAPLVWAGYAVYSGPWDWVVHQFFNTTPANIRMLGAAALVRIAAAVRRERTLLLDAFLGVTVAGGLLFLIQRKGWSNHYIAYQMGCLVVVAAAAVVVVRAVAAVRSVRAVRFELRVAPFVFGALFATGTLVKTLRDGVLPMYESSITAVIRRHTKPLDRVAVLDSCVAPAYPGLLLLDRRPGTRALFLFAAPMLFPAETWRGDYQSGVDQAAVERVWRELREDLGDSPPKLVLVNDNDRCQGCPYGFTMRGFLTAAGVTRLLDERYERVGTGLQGFSAYVPKSEAH